MAGTGTACGSAPWNIDPLVDAKGELRIKAVMGLAIGARPIITTLVALITGFNATPRQRSTHRSRDRSGQAGGERAGGDVLRHGPQAHGQRWPHFTRYLAPKWLEKHEPIVNRAEAIAGADAVCPLGQEVSCDD
jgi:hypothetical protein